MIGSRKSLQDNFPHLDAGWSEQLVMALRIREVSGARIGEILEEADAHCAATGRDAREAFGEPQAFAGSLDFEGQERAPSPVRRRDFVLGGVSLVGAGLVTAAGAALGEGEGVHFRLGHLLLTLVLIAMLVGVVRGLQWVVTHPVLAWLAGFALSGVGLGLMVWGGPELLRLPAMPSLIAGFVLMIAVAIAQTRETSARGGDLIVRPGVAPSSADTRGARRLALTGAWMLPVGMALLTLLSWSLHH